jgi:hypothetical protein
MAISLKPVDVAVIGLGAAGRHRDAASGVNLVRFEVDGRIYPGARLESGNFGGQAAPALGRPRGEARPIRGISRRAWR